MTSDTVELRFVAQNYNFLKNPPRLNIYHPLGLFFLFSDINSEF